MAVFIPIIAIYFSSRRELSIGWDFLLYELLSHKYPIIGFFLGLFICSLGKGRIPNLTKLWDYSRNSLHTYSFAWTVVLIVLSLSFIPYFTIRYKIYSETVFQRRALSQIDKLNFREARYICDSYLEIYPQRRENGTIPDDICIPILKFFHGMSMLDNYLRKYYGKKEIVEGLEIPTDWNAKTYAMHLTDKWAGNDRLSTRIESRLIPVSVPNELVEWAEGGIFRKNLATELDRKDNKIHDYDDIVDCKYRIQVASFSSIENARNLANELEALLGIDLLLQSVTVHKKNFTRVVVPCLDSLNEAEQIVVRINQKIGGTIVIEN